MHHIQRPMSTKESGKFSLNIGTTLGSDKFSKAILSLDAVESEKIASTWMDW